MTDARPVPRRFPADLLRAQISQVMASWGMPEDLVATTAAVMVDTDLAGVDSHGIQMLTSYEGLFRNGELRPGARPEVLRETAVSALVDAHGGLGHPAALMGMQLAVDKARESGVGMVVVRNSHHFGAAGHYAAVAAEHGMIGLVTTTTRKMVVLPTRAALPRLGTNPLAFAAPTGPGRPPFLLDMSTSTVAVNKVKVYELNGHPLPAGWVLDRTGTPVTDAAAAVQRIDAVPPEAGLSALGADPNLASHKGYGLAVAVQILAGTLSGAAFGPLRDPAAGREEIGHFFMAFDPTLFRSDAEFRADLDAVIDVLHDTPPNDSALPVLVAGDPEASNRDERIRAGVPVPGALLERLRGVCDRAGVVWLLG